MASFPSRLTFTGRREGSTDTGSASNLRKNRIRLYTVSQGILIHKLGTPSCRRTSQLR